MSLQSDQAHSPTLVPRGPIVSPGSTARTGILRGALIASSLALGIGAAALGMVQPSAALQEPPEQRVLQDVVPVPTLTTPPEISAEADNQPFIVETRIRAGDTLASILKRLDINDSNLLTFLTHDVKARAVYKLYPGRTVQAATTHGGDLLWIRYVHTPSSEADGKSIARLLEIKPDASGGFTARQVEEANESHMQVAVGTIQRSLFAATDDANIPDAVTSQMAEILSSKIDFLRDLRRGDQFRVVYEMRSFEGRHASAGKVLALEFINQGKTHNAVWYNQGGKSGSYYTLEGESLQGAFLRNAIKFSRISSTFGMRKNPIHNEWHGHAGVDYAAPMGTPIHATADGVIDVAGWQNGYGNVVIIKHHGKISTLYGHQSRFAEGIAKGVKVSQGQLIGYVGSTGWSTGAHLHYEFRVADKPIDPLSVTLPEPQPIETAQLENFAQAVSSYRQQLQVLAKFQDAVPETSSIASR